jgi:hypothetical protein
MQIMRDGFRYALLLAAGLVAVLFVIAFTAWGLTTYGSIRHVVGDLAAQPDKAAELRDQYQEMVTQFAGRKLVHVLLPLGADHRCPGAG